MASDPTRHRLNLASAGLGARALEATDDFFAPKERMLDDAPAVFIPGKYDDNGKWMDGWESRRRRGPGHDWCVVALATPGLIDGIDVDTRHFTGNYPRAAGLDAALWDGTGTPDWHPLLAPSELSGNASNPFELAPSGPWSHVRLNIFPDGGVARLRVYGRPARGPASAADGLVDLGAALGGARAVAWNDAHYGHPQNVLMPGIGANMAEGWETRRRREPGNDWMIVALAAPGRLRRVEVDTTHFKGNFPAACSLQGAFLPDVADSALVALSMFWDELLAPTPLRADACHVLADGLRDTPVTHVRFNIHPDGGVNRLRLFGTGA